MPRRIDPQIGVNVEDLRHAALLALEDMNHARKRQDE